MARLKHFLQDENGAIEKLVGSASNTKPQTLSYFEFQHVPLSRFTLKFAPLLTWYRTSFLDCLTRESPSQQLNRRSTATQIPKKALKQRSRPDPLELLPTVNLIAWQLAGGWQLTYPHHMSTVSVFHSLSYSHLACHAIHHQSPHSVVGKLETGMRISPHLTTSATEIRARTPPRCQTTPNGHVTPMAQHKSTKLQVTPQNHPKSCICIRKQWRGDMCLKCAKATSTPQPQRCPFSLLAPVAQTRWAHCHTIAAAKANRPVSAILNKLFQHVFFATRFENPWKSNDHQWSPSCQHTDWYIYATHYNYCDLRIYWL